MPNWCHTHIEIRNKEPHKIEKLNSLINTWKGKDGWLGSIILKSKVGTIGTNDKTDLPSHGAVLCNGIKDNILYINIISAYIPFIEMWKRIIDKYSSGSELQYVAEEQSMLVYSSNLPQFKDCYRVETRTDGNREIQLRDIKETELIPLLQEILKTEESDIEKLISMLDESDCRMLVTKWDYTGE